MTNYYEEKIAEIKTLKVKNPIKAFSLLLEELKMPYIPRKYEIIFQTLYKELKPLLNKKDVANLQINQETILDFLNSKDYQKNAIAIDNLKNINIHLIFNDLEKWIKEKDHDYQYNLHIALIYENMAEQNINKDLVIKNIKINPFKNGSIFVNKEIKNAFSFLLNSFEKEPQLQNVVISEMEIYFLKTFPIFPTNGEKLAKQFVNVIAFLFQKKVKLTLEEKKILEIINKQDFSL